jgi:hypothetical protein
MKSIASFARVVVGVGAVVAICGLPAASRSSTTACDQQGRTSDPLFQADSLEIANDCVGAGVNTILKAGWWGGYIDWHPGDPEVRCFNVGIYDDNGGVPGRILAAFPCVTPDSVISIGLCGQQPCFRYVLSMTVDVGPEPFWLGVQALWAAAAPARPYPPKWGRLGDEALEGFGSVTRVPGQEWVLIPICAECDVSQTFEFASAAATEPMSWGVLRSLYR